MKLLKLTGFKLYENCMVGTKDLYINPDHIVYIHVVEHLGKSTTCILLSSPHSGGMANSAPITLEGNVVEPLLYQLTGKERP